MISWWELQMFQGKFVLLQLCELSGLQLGLTQSGGRLKSWEYLDVWSLRADSQDSECFPPGWSPVG